MNSTELLRDDKKNTATVYNALVQHLTKLGADKKIEITPTEVTVINSPQMQISSLGVMRFSTQKGIATYVIGSSDPEFRAKWAAIFPSPAADPNAPPAKSFEFELLKSLFMAIEPILKANGFIVDSKSIVLQEGETLGDWAQVSVDQSLRMQINTNKGPLTFDLPLLTTEAVKNRTMDLYGLKDTARILVVDDSLVSRKHSRSCLAMAGYFNVDEAADGQAALSKVVGSHPRIELVVADWHMPNMSGFDLLKKIRAESEFKKLPVIMVTGEKNKDEVVSAIKEGVTAYLVKPVQLPAFVKALRKAGGRG